MATAATLKSITLENQLPELLERIRVKQADPDKNRDNTTMITADSTNNRTKLRTVTLQIPLEDVVDDTDGSIDTVAKEVYLD